MSPNAEPKQRKNCEQEPAEHTTAMALQQKTTSSFVYKTKH